jgi:cytidine deaminase
MGTGASRKLKPAKHHTDVQVMKSAGGQSEGDSKAKMAGEAQAEAEAEAKTTLRMHGEERDISEALRTMEGSHPAIYRAATRLGALKWLQEADFTLSAGQVDSIAKAAGSNPGDVADFFIPIAAMLALRPVSNFPVGAVAITASSHLMVMGANLEIAGAPMCTTVHAEQALIARAIARDPAGIDSVHLTIVPCGHCRQLLSEVCSARGFTLRLRGKNVDLSQLIPQKFGPGDLGLDPSLLVAPRPPGLLSRHLDPPRDEISGELVDQALACARRSFAPFSGCLSGMSVRLRGSGRILSSSCLESAAFNPSISPVTAVMAEVVAAGERLDEMAQAVLVQHGNSLVSHEAETRLVLQCAAPNATLAVYKAF